MTGDRLPMRAMQAIVLVGLMAVIQLGLAQPASACRCGSGLASDGELVPWIIDAPAIYVAHARLPDLARGRSFRVERTLNGPPRHNLRVVLHGNPLSMLLPGDSGAADCGLTSFPPLSRYLIVGDPDDLHINDCSEWAIGDEVVEQAIAQLGPGTEMPWRPDLAWLAQWVLLSAGAIFMVRAVWRRVRGRRARTMARGLPRP